MSRKLWPLRAARPAIEIVLSSPAASGSLTRTLLADTGAGNLQAGFELVLEESDCRLFGVITFRTVTLRGAYSGSFPVYSLRVQIPDLAFDHVLRAVGAPKAFPHFEGIAAFRFLNRFTYGNFGDPSRFGLET